MTQRGIRKLGYPEGSLLYNSTNPDTDYANFAQPMIDLVSQVCRIAGSPDQPTVYGEGHIGSANLRVTADSQTWLHFLAKEQNLVWALLRRKIRINGLPKLLQAFGRCFPS